MIYRGQDNAYLQIENVKCNNSFAQKETIESSLTFLWFTKDHSKLTIDGTTHVFCAHDIVCLTEFHAVNFTEICEVKMLRFNRPFYCISEHDSEIGCKGILFFGASQTPIIHIPKEDLNLLETVWHMFELEMISNDGLQLEMLQSMLKRFIILCTRLFKTQENYHAVDLSQMDLIRKYNFLVEQHFKTKHTVSEYADLLNKSPKTLANLFAKISDKSPLQYIQNRRMLEAKRLLSHSSKTVKEIAFDLGFEDLPSFSRFFKNKAGIAPSNYREKAL